MGLFVSTKNVLLLTKNVLDTHCLYATLPVQTSNMRCDRVQNDQEGHQGRACTVWCMLSAAEGNYPHLSKERIVLDFVDVMTEHSTTVPDYHVHDSYGDYLGRIIKYEWTGEWLFQTPHGNSVVLTYEEMKELNNFMNRLTSLNASEGKSDA